MKTIVGIGIVIGAIGLGYAIVGGHFHVLWQPAEYIIILGASVGAFIISNPSVVISHSIQGVIASFAGKGVDKTDFRQLLSLLFALFKLARTKGLLAVEEHIESPEESAIFTAFPKVLAQKEAVTFLCDYIRLMTMGSENVYQMEDLMLQELDMFEHEIHEPSSALTHMADGMPALGIVAAVLGVIHTMGSINEPPEVLGHLIGAALVGTFAGVLFAYGIVGPLASSVKSIEAGKIQFLSCVKIGLVAYLHGHPPMIATDYARKGIDSHFRPTFNEMEEDAQNVDIPKT